LVIREKGADLIISALNKGSIFDRNRNMENDCCEKEEEQILHVSNGSKATRQQLLYLFGSISLMNLSENGTTHNCFFYKYYLNSKNNIADCRKYVIQAGGIHAVYEAASKIHAAAAFDLNFIIHYAYRRISDESSGKTYVNQTGVPSLVELTKLSK
jgi:hypothetical protein